MEHWRKRRAFVLERRADHGARRGVQRHVEEQRAASGGERAAAGGGAFPFGAAGFVEMQVHVDEARKDGEAARIDFLAGSGQLSGRWR